MVINSKHTTLKFIPRGDNILACTKLNEAFFNIFNITINEHSSIIQPSIGQKNGSPIIHADVVINDIVYEQVKFIVVEAKDAASCIYVKQCDLKDGKPYKAPSASANLFTEAAAPLVHVTAPAAKKISAPPQPKIDLNDLDITSGRYIIDQIQTYADDVKNHLQQDLSEALATSKEVFVREQLSIKNDLQKDNAEHIKQAVGSLKGSLTKWAEDLQKSIIDQTTNSLTELQLETVQKLDSTLASSSQSICEQIQRDSTDVLAKLAVEFRSSFTETLHKHLKTLTDHSSNAQTDLEAYISEQIEQIQEDVVNAQSSKFDDQIQQFTTAQNKWVENYLTEKLSANTVALETKSSDLISSAKDEIKSHAQSLYSEHFKNVENSIADILNEKSANESGVLTEAHKRGTNIIKKTLDNHNVDIQKQLAAIRTEFHLKISKFFEGVGGGSVAMQFADGGTMNGSLDVRGSILSGGVDLAELFGGSGGSGYQTISFNESNGHLTITPFGNTVTLSALSGGNTPANSSQWNSVYTTVNANSATTWNYQGTDIKALTANWQNTTAAFNIQSPNNASVYTTVNANSAAWITDSTTDTGVRALTANWQNTTSVVQANSAAWAVDSTIDIGVRALTANWENTYTSFNTQSPNNASVYTTVNANSAAWAAGGSTIDAEVRSLTANWENTSSVVQANSAAWGADGNTIDTGVRALTSTWQSTTTAFNAQSSNNSSVYTTVNANSAAWSVDSTTDLSVRALTANWENTYTTVNANSAAWSIDSTIDTGIRALTATWQNTTIAFDLQKSNNISVYSTVNANSAAWIIDSTTDTGVRAITAAWQNTTDAFNVQSPNNSSVYTTVNANSAAWDTGGNIIDIGVRALTANWEDTYTVVQANSATWAIDSTTDTGVRAITAAWNSSYTTVNANSAAWSNPTSTADSYGEVWIGAGALTPASLSGASAYTMPITATGNEIYIDSFSFDSGLTQYALFNLSLPANANKQTIKAKFSWTAVTTASSGGVVWGIQAKSINDTDVISSGWGPPLEVSDLLNGSTTFQVTSATASISVSGSTTSDSMLMFKLYRNASAAADTLAVNAALYGVKIQYALSGTVSSSW